METSTKVKIVAVIGILAGPFLTYMGHLEKERLATLEKEGVTVEGRLEGGESHRSGKRSRSYHFDAVFTPQGGAPLTKTFKVTSGFFSAHTDDHSITDPRVQVRYLATNAQKSAIIVGGSDDDAAMFPVGIGAFVLGLGTLGVMMKRKG